ncbi:MAG: hypothetical protein QNJ68_17925 [Microcoleaceae cyanobacterium MO_207.B10]|nr:hypothetical protein [Microcoleaceae cyanobacterium MO_207.B10]
MRLKNTTKVFFSTATIVCGLISGVAVKNADAAILGFQKIEDTEKQFRYDIFFDNEFDLGSTISVGENWTLTVTEVFAVPFGETTAQQAIQLSNIANINSPHDEEGINDLPDIIFSRFEAAVGGGQQPHSPNGHFYIGMGNYFNLLGEARPENSLTCFECEEKAVWKLEAKLVHTPEPTSTLALISVGVIGTGAAFKRKNKA